MTSDQEDLEQAYRVLETMHGDLLRTAYLDETRSEVYIQQAKGVEDALNIFEQVLHGDWDAELATEALDEISAEENPQIDADALRGVSQHARSDELFVSDHPAIERAAIQPTSRSYWQILKGILP